MDSDDEQIDWSIHDLDHAPTLPLERGFLKSPRSRAQSDGNNRMSMMKSQSSRDVSGRPRLWSSGSITQLPNLPAPPSPYTKKPTPRFGFGQNYTRTSLSKLNVPHSPINESSRNLNEESLYASNSSLPPLPPLRTRFTLPDVEQTDHTPSSQPGSAFSESSNDDEDEENFDDETYSDDETPEENEEQAVIFLGMKMPRWMSKKRPSWIRLAACIVTRAPCFWCFSFHQKTDRAIMERLNILCAFFASGQIASALFLLICLVSSRIVERSVVETHSDELDVHEVDGASDEEDVYEVDGNQGSVIELLVSIWNINGSIWVIGVLAVIIFIAAFVTIPVIRSVNLLGAVRYLWALLWITPFEIFFVIGLFDYFNVTSVWIKHWWRDETLAWFRRYFCEPDTANTLCAAPITTNVTDWCLRKFQSTECESIRAAAQSDMRKFMLSYHYLNAVWGLCLILLLFLVVNTLESIISRPLVQKSRESNVPAWFFLPTVGSISVGSLYAFSNTSVLSVRSGSDHQASWIGPLYIATGGLFFVAAGLGWFTSSFSILNSRDKRYKLAAIITFILVTIVIMIMLVTIFAGSITFSISIVEAPISDRARGTIACFVDQANTCSRCNALVRRCPEWTRDDVTKVIQTQAKSSAALAAIFLLYTLSALRFGFSMRHYILMYQIDYV